MTATLTPIKTIKPPDEMIHHVAVSYKLLLDFAQSLDDEDEDEDEEGALQPSLVNDLATVLTGIGRPQTSDAVFRSVLIDYDDIDLQSATNLYEACNTINAFIVEFGMLWFHQVLDTHGLTLEQIAADEPPAHEVQAQKADTEPQQG